MDLPNFSVGTKQGVKCNLTIDLSHDETMDPSMTWPTNDHQPTRSNGLPPGDPKLFLKSIIFILNIFIVHG